MGTFKISCVAANLEIHVHRNDRWKNQYSSYKVRMVPNFNSMAQLYTTHSHGSITSRFQLPHLINHAQTGQSFLSLTIWSFCGWIDCVLFPESVGRFDHSCVSWPPVVGGPWVWGSEAERQPPVWYGRSPRHHWPSLLLLLNTAMKTSLDNIFV